MNKNCLQEYIFGCEIFLSFFFLLLCCWHWRGFHSKIIQTHARMQLFTFQSSFLLPIATVWWNRKRVASCNFLCFLLFYVHLFYLCDCVSFFFLSTSFGLSQSYMLLLFSDRMSTSSKLLCVVDLFRFALCSLLLLSSSFSTKATTTMSTTEWWWRRQQQQWLWLRQSWTYS